MDEIKIRKLLEKTQCIVDPKNTSIEPFLSVEDGSEYEVWLITENDKKHVLKKAKAHELEIYSCFFGNEISGAPRFLEAINDDGIDYFLMEYVSGEDICVCERSKLIKALDALISIQKAYWNHTSLSDKGYSFEKSLISRRDRSKYLKNVILEKAYGAFLEEYQIIPRTLCHDDLLPFNVIVSNENACLIDWEYGGILPYPVSLARLIAHGEEKEGALFYLKEEDRQFAIDYYYDKLIKSKGIPYDAYRRTMDLFFLYEYCEWIMLGNKYEDGDAAMLEKYTKIAHRHIEEMNSRWNLK